MKKRKSGYVKVSRNLFETKEIRALKRAEKAEGIGVFMIIVMHLAKLENAIGDEETLSVLSVLTGKKKWYVKHIINDYGLFTIDGEYFQCNLLRKSFKIETFLGKDDDDLDVEINEEGSAATVENHDSSSKSFPKSFSNLSSNSSSSLHYNVRVAAGASPIKDKMIKDKSSTGVLQKEPTTTTTDFHDVVERIFSNPQWLETVENQMQIRISTDPSVRSFVIQRFLEEIEMNGSYDDGEPFTESRAKRYFVNWVRPGKPPRHELDMKLNTLQREQEARSRVKKKKPFDGFGSIDSVGRRRGPHGEIVPMDAPACMDVMMEWNERHQRWE
jgi:hypothetical protein